MKQIETRCYRFPDPTIPSALWEMRPSLTEFRAQGTPEAFELLQRLPHRGLAVVGTRTPSERSTRILREWIHGLRKEDLVIVSGFARGIDATAHEAAIRVGLPTIAVIGTGLDVNYPEENAGLRKQILAANGLIVTEHPDGFRPAPDHFISRNRIIAHWTQATWVVQASFRSGALNTARWARDAGRDCYAVSCFPEDLSMAGNQKLIDSNLAYAFWDIHSLGPTWIELSTLSRKERDKFRQIPHKFAALRQDIHLLAHRIRFLAEHRNRVSVSELLAWTVGHSWTPRKFYQVLHPTVQLCGLTEKNGLLLKKEDTPG